MLGSCEPIGVADKTKISDDKLTASTFYKGSTPFHPYLGRLYETNGRGGWCPATSSNSADFLQVDLGAVHHVCAVATQGRKEGQRTTSYKLQLSPDGRNWDVYSEKGLEKVSKWTWSNKETALLRENRRRGQTSYQNPLHTPKYYIFIKIRLVSSIYLLKQTDFSS